MPTINRNNVTDLKNEVLYGTQFIACPACGNVELHKFDSDHFCLNCDWNSVLHDVNSGNFEKRIGLLTRNRKHTPNGSSDIIYLDSQESGVSHVEPIKRRKP